MWTLSRSRTASTTIKISPTGEYFAATVPLEDRTALVIMSRTDKKLLGTFQLGTQYRTSPISIGSARIAC